MVTGAGRGIGKRLAIGFATAGARVGLLARSKAELDLCHLEIEHAGGNALRIRADISDYEQVAASVERMRVQFRESRPGSGLRGRRARAHRPIRRNEPEDVAGSCADEFSGRDERLPRDFAADDPKAQRKNYCFDRTRAVALPAQLRCIRGDEGRRRQSG